MKVIYPFAQWRELATFVFHAPQTFPVNYINSLKLKIYLMRNK